MTRFHFRLLTALFIAALSCASVWAQATAQISGTVKDQSGAVLPGVEITATQTATGISRMTVTNETGSFVLPNLPVGPYKVEAALPGFRSFAQTGIELQVNSSPVVNPVLEVGQVSEQVEVQANAALVETRNQGVGQVVENAQILELPLNGRSVNDLITLAAATVPANGGGTGTGAVFNRGESAATIAGGLTFGVAYALDGATHNNPSNGLSLSSPFPDALQEFKVETSATSAQNGTHSAGSVSLVTKSGTNTIHGDLFEFVRNGRFNARNTFALKRDSLKRNQFGGTLGGPIKQNKLFFFGGYQGTTIRQDPSDTTVFLPSAATLAGDFTAFTSPACNAGRQIALRAPFVNNRIDPSLYSRAALNLAAKLPRTDDPCGKFVYGNRVVENDYTAVGKIDYQRNAKHSMFGRYLADHADLPSPYDSNKQNILGSNVRSLSGLTQAFTFGDTYLFGPNVVNAFRLAANRLSSDQLLTRDLFSWADVGVKMYNYLPKFTNMSITGGPTLGSGAAGGGGDVTSQIAIFSLNDDITVVHGNHQLAFGWSGSRSYVNTYVESLAGAPGVFNGSITGLGMADFLTGNLVTFTQSPPEIHNMAQKFMSLYVTDTWKSSKNLTFNFGVRWEPFFAPNFKDGTAYRFDLAALRAGVKSTIYKNAPPGIFYPGDPQLKGDQVMTNQWAHFSPRVGLAWDPAGDGRTSIRAAFGTFYDFSPTNLHLGTNIAPPFDPRVSVNNVKLDDPWAAYPGGNPFPTSTGPNALFPPRSVFAVLNPGSQNPTVTQWNLSIQRQVAPNWLVSASYLGTNTVHLWTVRARNYSVFIPGASCVLEGVTWTPCSQTANTDQRRVLSLENPQVGQAFAFVNEIDDGATASYNGLVLNARHNASRGLTIDANYTFSHCISDPYFGILNGAAGGGAYTNPNNRRADRGNCGTSAVDRRHILNLTASAQSPQLSGSILKRVISGWRLSPIVRIQSGSFFSITTTLDAALSSITGQRVNQVLGDAYGDKTPAKYLNPAAFAQPALGTQSNMGANTIKGPNYWTWDAALSRTFRLGEDRRIDVRAEAFNITNSVRLSNPTNSLNSNIFGQINSARDPRIMQFALKYLF